MASEKMSETVVAVHPEQDTRVPRTASGGQEVRKVGGSWGGSLRCRAWQSRAPHSAGTYALCRTLRGQGVSGPAPLATPSYRLLGGSEAVERDELTLTQLDN